MVRTGLPVRLDRQVAAAAARRPGQVAGETGHAVVAVGAIRLRNPRPPGDAAVVGARTRHQLGARRPAVEMRPRRHRLLDTADLPFPFRVDNPALSQTGHLAIVPISELEAAPTVVSAAQAEN